MKINVRMSAEFDLYLEEQAEVEWEHKEAERKHAERIERVKYGLREYSLHLKPFWYYEDSIDDMLAVTITDENLEELEAEIAEAERKEEEWNRQADKDLRELEEFMETHPYDSEVAGYYSDYYKDRHGIRPHWRLNAWYYASHPEEQA